CRAVATGKLVGHRQGDVRPMLGTAESLRLEQIPKACLPKILDGLVRDAALLTGRRCALAQDRRQRPRLLLQALGDVGIESSFVQLWHDGSSPALSADDVIE